jgi:sialate O-acetylesterase
MCAGGVYAAVQPHALFQNSMVLQRRCAAPVWGNDTPGQTVTVAFAGQRVRAVADAQGRWLARLAPLRASTQPSTLIIAGSTRVALTNVLVGDVWVCSGQSNMEWPLINASNGAAEVAAAGQYPTLRLFTVPRATALTPQTTNDGTWEVSGPKTAGDFSAVATFFGRELIARRGVPIGLIDSSWGGTPIESWTRRAALEAIPFMTNRLKGADEAVAKYDPKKVKEQFERATAAWPTNAAALKALGKPEPPEPQLWNPHTSPWQPCSLYNAMIAPLQPFAIRGVLWYQGEANAGNAAQYQTLFPAMIEDWRAQWGCGAFPFLFVQLANFLEVQTAPVQGNASWPYLREAQTMTLRLTNTAMACAIDIGEAKDIHPRNKQEVGRRLALAARALVDGETLEYAGPQFAEYKITGSNVTVRFTHVGGGLVARGDTLRGFAVCGADSNWVWATATIMGPCVGLTAPSVPKPVAVRYNWANNPVGNLYNKDGLPAPPFRTDM